MNTLRFILIFTLVGFLSPSISAQQDDFGWAFGVGTGFMSYHGDLTYSDNAADNIKRHFKFKNQNRTLTYFFQAERRISSGMGVLLSSNIGKFSANDRSNESNYFYDRSLNFKTTIRDFSADFVLKTDNDYVLGESAIFAPYMFFGLGFTSFSVFGDLKDGDGNYYNYIDGNTVEQDGNFETELTNIGTEESSNYSTIIPNANLGMGIRVRLMNRLSLHYQIDIKYLFNDNIDDVNNARYRQEFDNIDQAIAAAPNPHYAGPRGNPNNRNDIYAASSLFLRFSFGRKQEGFKPPIFFAPPTMIDTTVVSYFNVEPLFEAQAKQATATKPKLVEETVEDVLPIIEAQENTEESNQKANDLEAQITELQRQLSEVNSNSISTPIETSGLNINDLSKPSSGDSDLQQIRNDIQLLNMQMAALIAGLNAAGQVQQQNAYNNSSAGSMSSSMTHLEAETQALQERADALQMELDKQNGTFKPSILTNDEATAILIKEESEYLNKVSSIGNQSIFFEESSAVIRPAELSQIERFAEVLKDYPQAKISISSFETDSKSTYYRHTLPEKRAVAVQERLIYSYQIQPNQIIIKPAQSQSKSLNKTAINSRVDIEWIK